MAASMAIPFWLQGIMRGPLSESDRLTVLVQTLHCKCPDLIAVNKAIWGVLKFLIISVTRDAALKTTKVLDECCD